MMQIDYQRHLKLSPDTVATELPGLSGAKNNSTLITAKVPDLELKPLTLDLKPIWLD